MFAGRIRTGSGESADGGLKPAVAPGPAGGATRVPPGSVSGKSPSSSIGDHGTGPPLGAGNAPKAGRHPSQGVWSAATGPTAVETAAAARAGAWATADAGQVQRQQKQSEGGERGEVEQVGLLDVEQVEQQVDAEDDGGGNGEHQFPPGVRALVVLIPRSADS